MVANVYKWDAQNAAGNANADSEINWNEGQAPNTVNDSARGMMQGVAAWRSSMNGASVTCTGSGGQYIVSTPGAYVDPPHDGLTIGFKANHTNTNAVGEATLKVDSCLAKNLRKASGKRIAQFELRQDTYYQAVYVAATSEFILVGGNYHPGIAVAWGTTVSPTGTNSLFFQGYNIASIVSPGVIKTVTFESPIGDFPTPPAGTDPNFQPYTVTGSTSAALTFSVQNKLKTGFNYRLYRGETAITGPIDFGVGYFVDFVVHVTTRY